MSESPPPEATPAGEPATPDPALEAAAQAGGVGCGRSREPRACGPVARHTAARGRVAGRHASIGIPRCWATS